MPPIVSFQDVSLLTADKYVLHDVSFHVNTGEKFFIMGGDGSGRSTILKIMVGLLNFQEGNVYIFDKNLKTLSRRELIETRMRIGYMFQEGALAANLTVLENLMLPLRYHMIYGEDLTPNIARELLTTVGMQDYCDRYPADLNLGMKKRVGIARALVMNPELVLYDDPSADIDGLLRRRLEEHIIWLHDKLGITSIIVTNNLQFTMREADKLLLMDRGRVVAFGSLRDLEACEDEKIKNFLVTGNLAKIF